MPRNKFPETAYDPIKFERFKAGEGAQSKSSHSSSRPSSQISPKPCSSSTLPTTSTSSLSPSNTVTLVCTDPKNSEEIPGPSHQLTEAEKTNLYPVENSFEQIEFEEAEMQTGGKDTDKYTFEIFIRKKKNCSKMFLKLLKTQPNQGKGRRLVSQGVGEILTSKMVEQRLREEQETKKAKVSKAKKPSKKHVLGLKIKKKIPGFDEEKTTSEDEHDLDPKLLESDDDEDDDWKLFERENEVEEQTGDDGEQIGDVTLEVEKYFAVFYDITWYLGRITSLNEDTCTVKFLKENLEKFNWPSHDDIQEVDKEYIFYGPVKLIGNGPFTLKRLDFVRIKSLYSAKKKELTYKSYN